MGPLPVHVDIPDALYLLFLGRHETVRGGCGQLSPI